MKNKDFELKVFYDDNTKSYKFELDYGEADFAYCTVDEKNNVFIYFGNVPDEVYNKRKKDMLECFLSEIFKEKSLIMIENVYENEPFSYEKVKKFIFDNNICVGQFDEQSDYQETFNQVEEYQSICVYDEGLQTVDFYIKSKIFDDEMGIKINSDGSFIPIISTKHIILTKEAVRLREDMIKKYVYNVLKIRINFGTVDGIKGLKILELYKRAVSYALENGIINYTDNDGNLYVYKDRASIK